jgi:DNA-binding transcriptional regulator LsrR (DeoR family)
MSRVFISYAQADLAFARQLYRRLTQDGIDCFFDKESIDIGENWLDRLEAELTACEFLLLVISPDFLSSRWSAIERSAVMTRDSDSVQAKIIPLIRRSASLPAFLNALQAVDVSTTERFDQNYPKLCSRLGAVSGSATTEGTIARRFGLRKVLLAKARGGDADITAALGQAAADYFVENISERSRVAFSCANTVFQIAKALPKFDRKLFLYPISYNVDPEMLSVRSPYSTLLEICSKNPQAVAHTIPLPAYYLSQQERTLVRGRGDIDDLLREAYDPNAAFYSVGDVGPGSSYDVATPYIRRYLRPSFHRQELIDLGAVGEINLFPFDSSGAPIDHPLASLCACLDLSRIRVLAQDPRRDMVLVAGGRRKTSAILAALRGGLLNVLVTDLGTAQEIVAGIHAGREQPAEGPDAG